MPCRVVLGGQWGDEGKGKVVDYLSAEADVVVRCQGGANAGHTLVQNDRNLVVHLVPSAVLHPDVQLIMGNGMVIDPLGLVQEITDLEELGAKVRQRLWVSPNAHLVLPYHKLQDAVEEKLRGGKGIGTTGRGIGPAYADKAARTGLTMGLFLDGEQPGRVRLRQVADRKLDILRGLDGELQFDVETMLDEVLACRETLAPMLRDTGTFLRKNLDERRQVLLEGAQGAMLDIDHGSYPYVTSSSCTSAGVLSGCGLAPKDLTRVTGIVKAYATRVGSGPFPTELFEEDGERLREIGREFGATTGRPRRCGWFDAVAARHAARISGFDELVVTKLDVLDQFERIKIATAYEVRSQRSDEFPLDVGVLEECRPCYVSLPGWRESTRSCRSKQDLPGAASRFLDALQDYVGVPVRYVSVGPDRGSMFDMQA